MFSKYMGQLGKAEAEWVQEVLDRAEGDVSIAKDMVEQALHKYIDWTKACQDFDKQRRSVKGRLLALVGKQPETPKAPDHFILSVGGATLATQGRWWEEGLAYLQS